MGNNGTVLELQREALDNSSDIVGLLRKSKIIEVIAKLSFA